MIVQPGKAGWVEILAAPEQLGVILQGVIPPDDRFYDGTKWHILKKHLLSVVRAGYEISGRVDYSRMPGPSQVEIAHEKQNWVPGSVRVLPSSAPKTDPYEILFLHQSAPRSIIKSVWRQLLKEHHPDKGGDPVEFQKYKDAYEEVAKRWVKV